MTGFVQGASTSRLHRQAGVTTLLTGCGRYGTRIFKGQSGLWPLCRVCFRPTLLDLDAEPQDAERYLQINQNGTTAILEGPLTMQQVNDSSAGKDTQE